MASGRRYWRLTQRIDGKLQRLSLGVDPKVSLDQGAAKWRIRAGRPEDAC